MNLGLFIAIKYRFEFVFKSANICGIFTNQDVQSIVMLQSYFFNFLESNVSVGLERAKAQWWVISLKLTLVQNNLHHHYASLFPVRLPLPVHWRNFLSEERIRSLLCIGMLEP